MERKLAQSQSRRRNRQLIAVFADRTIAKNDRGITEHGGGLQFKNTLPEIMDEMFDLVNYLVEHEQQVKALVEAAVDVHATLWGTPKEHQQAHEALRLTLAPFLNKPKKHK